MSETKYTAADYKSGQPRWCPGCGDHAFLNSFHKALAELGVPPHEIAVISGIGCSSRLPYYMNTYGMHTIHGRAAAIATGAKVANPNLTIWQISGDGDGLAIGGNHFIHAIRRNVDINIILLNNRIYGLTKGQYSPTSARGFVSKSSPYGTVEDPFRPADLCFGARGRFFARMRNFQRQLVADGLKLKAYPFTKILDVDHASDIVKAENFLTGKDE
jgi:2-oxoglutarate ferredoxin oxidoreductase subunit beta